MKKQLKALSDLIRNIIIIKYNQIKSIKVLITTKV